MEDVIEGADKVEVSVMKERKKKGGVIAVRRWAVRGERGDRDIHGGVGGGVVVLVVAESEGEKERWRQDSSSSSSSSGNVSPSTSSSSSSTDGQAEIPPEPPPVMTWWMSFSNQDPTPAPTSNPIPPSHPPPLLLHTPPSLSLHPLSHTRNLHLRSYIHAALSVKCHTDGPIEFKII